MATITIISASRALFYPGESSSLMLRITNNGTKTITGIKVQAQVYGDDLGTDAGTVDLGYLIGSKNAFYTMTLAKGKSIDVPAYFAAPNNIEFAQGIRKVPINLRFTEMYSDGSMFGVQAVLENAYLMNYRYAPRIDSFKVQRANDKGQSSDEGEFMLLDLKLGLRDVRETAFMTLKLHYQEDAPATTASRYIDLTASIPNLLVGVKGNTTLVPGSIYPFDTDSNWGFLLVFGDEYESVSETRTFARSFANVHLSGRPEGGVCLGGFCSTDKPASFECYFPAYFYGGIVVGGNADFSLEEVATGIRWIDGKMIYKRVFTGKVSASTTKDLATNIGFDTVLKCEGILTYTSSAGLLIQRSLNYYNSSSTHSRVYTGDGDGGKIQVHSTQAGDVFVILEYTKKE